MSTFAAAALLALLLTAAYRWLALQRGWVARPTARSSHSVPTANAGGVAVLLAFALVLAPSAASLPDVYRWLVMLALLLVPVGFADDLRHLPVTLRLAIYALAALLGALLVAQTHPLPVALVGVLAIWLLVFTNFYNFMDGIDGLAALQCIAACLMAAALARHTGADAAYQLLCLALAGAHLGFLVFNWPPARLFLGDAGSIPTGFLLAVLALTGTVLEGLPAACWAILLAGFVTDAGFTLAARLLRGQRIVEAHREHLYQRLARRWGSHRRVAIAFLALQCLWLFPLAAGAVYYPQRASFAVVLAYATLIFIMVKGRRLQ